ncbi:uncharacterized protein LOC110826808 [Zootermopsis nevadensis]|uniref:uncharacterized protein LOC110826808 n=1 Tax=Zootermopsis nevadensis TaxID=136037 RepID=UPI000B8E4B7F|nr:uncharacterized protein LOC110826808 [Zootermopsis nevadensis]
MALKDLFEVALTALAFKSFGLFCINVIMCISGGYGTMPTTTATEDVGRQRSRRTASSYPLASAEALNAMSLHVLRSVEVFVAHDDDDDDQCLRQTLCEINRFSRRLEGTDRVWLPVWSLGLSWVAGRFTTAEHASSAMLDYLRASVTGLGNSKCEVIYPRCSIQEVSKFRADRRQHRGDRGEL